MNSGELVDLHIQFSDKAERVVDDIIQADDRTYAEFVRDAIDHYVDIHNLQKAGNRILTLRKGQVAELVIP